MVVTEVKKLEPLPLRLQWMDDIAQVVAFLESLNLAHGDLRPENILLDRDRLKLPDFDCIAEIGLDFEACTYPYGRVLNGNELEQGQRRSTGFMGPRAEQFAYYLINYSFEVYGDRCLAKNPREHGVKGGDLLRDMEFPKPDCEPRIDDIIDNCWHNRYSTVAELASSTKVLLSEETRGERPHTEPIRIEWLDRVTRGLWHMFSDWWMIFNGEAMTPVAPSGPESPGDSFDVDQHHTATDSSSMRAVCEDLTQRGLLDFLALNEPEKLGFKFEFYRYSLR